MALDMFRDNRSPLSRAVDVGIDAVAEAAGIKTPTIEPVFTIACYRAGLLNGMLRSSKRTAHGEW
jgi:hypothetical protein